VTGAGGSEPRLVQNVTAVGGFAYGAVGADVHVFGNGLPLYLLANWHTPADADPEWLRELPSRMLNARRAVVPFTGREDELAQLRRWRDDGPRLAARWLHGPGGAGKTRLAAELAAESAAAGWRVIAAFHGPDADPIEPGSQDLSLADRAGVLVIVDYADRWLITNLTWLLKNALLHRAGVPTRVLLVARTADGWPAVRAILDTHQAGTSSRLLPSLAVAGDERTGMFTVARDSFAALYQAPSPGEIEAPGPLDDPEFGLTLAVHMAALVAVDARVRGDRPPADMAGLTMYLLDREQLHWRRLYGDHADRPDAGHTYRTAPEVMNQAVFTAAITGTVPRGVGTALLASLDLADPEQVVDDHAVCYPPAEPAGKSVLEPLYPDRLAEDFLALTMPGHRADYPAQPWASATTALLLARHGGRRTPAAWTARAVTFLASAASRWPHLGTGNLYPLLLGDPQLALDAGSAALSVIAGLPDITPAVLEAIEARLSDQRHVDLDPGIAALAVRLAEYRLTLSEDPAEQARIHGDLGGRLLNAGLDRQGLAAAQTALEIRRRLAESGSHEDQIFLALAVNNLGVMLLQAGRWRETIAPFREAVELARRLGGPDSGAPMPLFPMALVNLGAGLRSAGQWEEALAATGEAVAVHRRLASANPDAHLPTLGTMLNNQGVFLGETGRGEEALAAVREAVEIRRRLAGDDPSAHLSHLADSLGNLGAASWGVGRRPDALAATEEAVEIRRRLARANPDAQESALAMSLANRGVFLSGAGRFQEALAAAEEAVEIRRRLARISPDTQEPELAASLTVMGNQLSILGRQQEAEAAFQAALVLLRRLAEVNPDFHLRNLAMVLNNLGNTLARAGQHQDGLDALQEAVEIRRRLAQAHPAAHEPDLATALANLSSVLGAVERQQDSLDALQEAVAIFRRQVRSGASAYEPELARSLASLGDFLSGTGRLEEALDAFVEAAAAYQHLTEPAAGTYAKQLEDAQRRAVEIAHRLKANKEDRPASAR
jgi:tetratricopeptide (TPR) repeat protein